ncbi:MAG: hypothetical protein ABR981_01825 [Candidatus Micrarchaeaceae archaeon]
MALFSNKKKSKPHKQHAQASEENPQYQVKKKPNNKPIIIGIIIVIIALIAVYFLFVVNVNESVINSATTVNVTQSGNLYSINSNQYYISLSSISLTSGKAYIHVSKFPIFVNPILNVSLTLNNITKINDGTNYANIAFQLQSLSPSSISVKITPTPTSLQIAPDTQDIRTLNGNLYSGNQNSYTTTIPSTTTIQGKSTTSTVGSSTTTIAQNTTLANITAALKIDSYYPIMLNFSKLYANTTQCTPVMYNTSYIKSFGHAPHGQDTYYNVTPYVPYKIYNNTTSLGNGKYEVLFKVETTDPGFNNTVALTIAISSSNRNIINDTLSGIFEDLTLSEWKSSYQGALSVGNACGVVVP